MCAEPIRLQLSHDYRWAHHKEANAGWGRVCMCTPRMRCHVYMCTLCIFVLLNALYIFMTMSCDCNPVCHSLMARVPRPSFCMPVTQYIQHCGKLGYGSRDYPFSGTPTGSVVVSCRLVQPGLAWILANLLPRVCFISKEVYWKCFLQVLAILQVINTCIFGGSLYYLARESQWY